MSNIKKPHHSEFYTDQGLHSAMKAYCNKISKQGSLKVVATFKDGSEFVDYIDRENKELTYKTRDGELYSETYKGSKFHDDVYMDAPLTVGKAKQAVSNWLVNPGPVKISFELAGV